MAVGCCAQRILAPRSFGRNSSVYKVGTSTSEASCALYKQYNTTPNHYFKNASLIFNNQRCQNLNSTFSRSRHLFSSSKLLGYPRLTPQEVNTMLRANEFTQEFPSTSSVKSYDSSQLQSNNPIEDTRCEARCLLTTGMLLGIFDGHGGGSCAQVVAKRLFQYIAASLLPPDLLNKYVSSSELPELLEAYNDNVEFVDELKDLYTSSFHKYLKSLSAEERKDFNMMTSLEKSFLKLDDDLSREADPKEAGKASSKTLAVAASGAVACVAHIDGPHLHVASSGDCQAVLGSLSELNRWTATKLTTEHNSDNAKEYQRILSEHPNNERDSVIKLDRLLGQLAPLRAFGDFKYKWSKKMISELFVPYLGENSIPPNYYTPPYLTARPEIKVHRLSPRDKFLVIASDGLWDLISPLQVVRLVGEHMSGKVTLSPFRLPKNNIKLNEINQLLLQRKEGLKMKPLDTNAATHLIRNALGGTEYGIDHGKLSQLLSMPDDMVRVFRDDITATVIYFDSEFLRRCPP